MRHHNRRRRPYGYVSPIASHEHPKRLERLRNASCGHPVGASLALLGDRYTLIWRRCQPSDSEVEVPRLGDPPNTHYVPGEVPS
jgi:hypothetical protein